MRDAIWHPPVSEAICHTAPAVGGCLAATQGVCLYPVNRGKGCKPAGARAVSQKSRHVNIQNLQVLMVAT